jgi:hypothetical protein
VGRAYARGQYWEERVGMMQYWSAYLDPLRGGNAKGAAADNGKVST